MGTPHRWNPDKRDRDGGKPLLKSLKANGAVCCASTDPTHMCSDCKAKMKGRRGRSDNSLVANAASVNEWGLTANEMVDLCDSSMEMTRRAGEASDKANQSRDPADHGAAADEHDNAEDWHDSAADERTGTAATVHSQFARDHHMMADQHRATGDFLARPEEPPAANDYEDDVDDSSDATQNQNHQPPRRRTTMTTRRPGQATQYLAQLRSQGVGGRALEQIENRLRHQTLTHNCSCDGSRRHEEGDALVPPTMNQILGIGGPEPTTNSRMPGRNELIYGGIVEGDEPDDALMTPALNYGRLTANVTGSAAGHSGHSVPGGKGYLTQSARDRQNIPGFNVPGFDEYPEGNTGAYPKDGYREIPPLTSGRPRVKPTLGPPESGGNVGSYPRQGTRGDMGETDSAGDDYEDDSAPAGRGAGTSGPRGSRTDRGRTVSNPVPQYGDAPPVEDRGDEQRGQIHTAGMSNAIYASDYWKRMTPGGIGEGANALPQDADGQDYRRSPTQDEDDDRRQFGNQKKRRPTANVETDALIAPTIDWADRVAELNRTGR